ncbi:hypothetical protein [Escherichia coli]|uniref:F4 family fimbrial subunit n=1 Tax=Escherichia coli TaxID=562 RepID=UPI003D795E3B
MKKTLIALAVAASAAVSGSAMAWTANGTGGSVDLGGTLTPADVVTPWEVKVGDAVSGLDAQIQKGQKVVDIAVKKTIPVLGIRNNHKNGFVGENGITPQINYDGKVNIDSMKNGVATISLEVTSADTKIGTLSADMRVAAQANNGKDNNVMLYAHDAGFAFFGGVAKNEAGVWNHGDAYAWAVRVFPGIADTWSDNNTRYEGKSGPYQFTSTGHTYHGYYASAIDQNKTIKLTLEQAASGDDPIQWKASLPITVSYQ